jgi:hypothetical protein
MYIAASTQFRINLRCMKKCKIHQQAAVGSASGVDFMKYTLTLWDQYIAKVEKNVC